jgi:hypothetical protein
MPISGLTDAPKAFMKLGMIKKGEKRKVTKQGKNGPYEIEIPVDLDYFRVIFSPGKLAGEIEKAFRAAYGDRPQELNVRFADASVKEVWDANYECYKQGGLIAKAGTNDSGAYWIFYRDPETMEVLVRNGAPVGEEGRKFFEKPIDLEAPIYHLGNGDPALLETVGRLQVVIPEVAHLAVGYFVFQPGSPRDIRNISAELGMYAAMASSYGNTITGIPFVLGRRKEEITKNINGKLSKGESFPVHLTAGGIWGRQAIEMIERLALPEYVEAEVREVTQNAPDWTDAPEEWSEPGIEEPPAQVIATEQPVPSKAMPRPEIVVEMTDPLDEKAVGYAAQMWSVNAANAKKQIREALGAGKIQSPMPKADFKAWVNPQPK